MRDAGQGVLRGPNGASRLCALLGLVSITVGLLAAIGGTAAAATRPHFRPHAHVISRGQVLTMRLDVGRARHCTLFERGPGGRHLKHRYGVSPPAALFTVAARSSTAHGRWRLSMLCRTARDRRLTVARTSVRVVRTHGAGVLGGADVAAWPDASTPQRRTISGAGFGGGPVPNPFEIGQCTWWAFNMRAEVYLDSVNSGAPKGGWNGGAWKTYAAIGHFPEGTAPRVGALVSYGPGTNADPGHVAYVTQVIDNDHFVTSEMNTDGANLKSYRVFTRYYWRGTPGAGSRGYRYTKNLPGDARFIYAKPQPLEGAPVSIQGSNIPIQGSSTPIQGTATPQPGTGGASPTPAPTSAPTPAPTPAPP
ncbi:MAG: peptidoglycan DL-endopeptidase CwlO, partial [Pseudonocardiales bacterium]|nr:peptidoglycan DL-endopeptidase CwlO [Pseudonocardiales bacterium]